MRFFIPGKQKTVAIFLRFTDPDLRKLHRQNHPIYSGSLLHPFHQLTRTFNLPSLVIEITLIKPHIVGRSECRVLTVNASDLSVLLCFFT